MLKQPVSQNSHRLVDDPVQGRVCPLCWLLTALWVTLPAALHQGPARCDKNIKVNFQLITALFFPHEWELRISIFELLIYLKEGQQLTKAMVLETYPSPRSPNSAWVSWNISTFLWKLVTQRLYKNYWNANSVSSYCQITGSDVI